MSNTLRCLGSLCDGECGNVVSIEAHGELGRRIRSMGLVVGMNVTVMGRAPMRDPLTLRFANTSVALRRNEANAIFVSSNT